MVCRSMMFLVKKLIYPGGTENGTGHLEYTYWKTGRLKEVIDKLSELGVKYAQGFYIARPTSVQTFEPWAEETANSRSA